MRRHGAREVVTTAYLVRVELDLLLKEIESIWTLPMEVPEGSEDIYGLDTGVAVDTEGLHWKNTRFVGCVGSDSTLQPTEAQRASFRAIVDRIIKEADSRAPARD